MIVIGIDPGQSGALALYDGRTNTLTVQDMPTLDGVARSGQKKAGQIDAHALRDFFQVAHHLRAHGVFVEQVGGFMQGRDGNGGAAMFKFGFGAGLLRMASVAFEIPYYQVPPANWKRVMQVPGKKGEGVTTRAFDEAICAVATNVFPAYRAEFYGPKGGAKSGRAEAALIAKYGHDHMLGKGA